MNDDAIIQGLERLGSILAERKKDEKPMTPEQVRASTSRAMCSCGHRELVHVVPDPDDPEAPRECFPVPADDDDVDNMGCDCMFFTPAANQHPQEGRNS
jgi:hypothetical protein